MAKATLRLDAAVAFIPVAVDFARAFFQAHPYLAGRGTLNYALQLVISEALTNVVKHAYAGRDDGWMQLALDVDPGQVRLSVSDAGQAFDPASIPSPDFEDPKGHGLGFFIIRENADALEYVTTPEGNDLRLVKRITPEQPDLES